MRTLNLGILAHVDAGKTTLTERLLYAAGVIDRIGRVDDGDTQTDTLELERRRGITIKSAIVSFRIGEVTVNLIDTPGHPDFIAEVERVLSVLDGAVLVVSAVEGVQAQTRILMRTLARLGIPTLIFVNKIDRPGARDEAVLGAIAAKLSPGIVPMGAARGLGTRSPAFEPYSGPDFTARLTDVLTERDDELLGRVVAGPVLPERALRAELAAQTARTAVHPVFFGSAVTGAGVPELMDGIATLLPAGAGDPDAPVSGSVFKVERGPAGEKIAFVRMFSGTVRVRDRLRFGENAEGKVTAISVFDGGSARQAPALAAGRIGRLWGLADVRIGDAIGAARAEVPRHHFAPPTMETAIVPVRPAQKGALHAALTQLAEQDPLIDLRQDDVRQELYVSLYGEVQKEVIEATLAYEYGIDVAFRETSMICIERPIRTGAAVDLLGRNGNPFLATVGLRIDPAPPGSGLQFRLEVKVDSIPMYVYKTIEEFRESMSSTVRETFEQGIHGWQVTDCVVTMTDSDYTPPDTTAAAFKRLTPLVLMSALARCGTVVCEPIHRFTVDVPADAVGAVLRALARLGAVPQTPVDQGLSYLLEGTIRAAGVHELRQQLPALTHGEGVLESSFDSYEPVRGNPPSRPRTDFNPLNRKEYLLHVERRL